MRRTSVSEWAWSLLFPPCCAGCRTSLGVEESIPSEKNPLGGFCRQCQEGMFVMQEPQCSTCGHPLTQNKTHCQRCILQPPAFDRATSLFAYAGAIRAALHRYKFRDDHAAGRILQAVFQQYTTPLSHDWKQYDRVLCVPLHPRRLKQRGFNQAWQLLHAMTVVTGEQKSPDILQRLKETKPQYQLGHHERQDNLEQAFRVAPKQRHNVQNQSILLIDDLLTTGATAHQCSQALKLAGAKKIDVITLCRAIL